MRSFVLRWVLACGAAELVGIGFGALVGQLMTPVVLGPPSFGAKALLLCAAAAIGVVEGSALGLLQGATLRQRLPRLRPREWAMPVVLFAALGWVAGMLRPILGQGTFAEAAAAPSSEPPLAMVLVLASAVGAVAGVLLGFVQWLVLRRHAARSGRWIGANALGWALAMPAIFAGFGIPADDASSSVRLLSGALGGALGGLLLGLATAPFAARLEPWVDESRRALAGKTAVVTGATSGIGFEVAVGVARLGARTILLGHDAQKLDAAQSEIRRRIPTATVECVVCDLSRDASIDSAAAELRERAPAIDLLVHDAAATFDHRVVTEDGVEATVAVDALGPARLTHALDEQLTRGARIVVLTGIYQRRGVIDRSDLHFARRPYSMAAANAQAQRMRVAFVGALAARRADLFVAAVHPGAVRTAAIERAPAWARALAATVARPAFVRAELGALPVLRLLTVSDLPSGRFWNRFGLEEDRASAEEMGVFEDACGVLG